MLVSFVIPCYHSEQTLGAVVAEIDGTMKTMPGYTWEIICVNDGTPNACWKKIQELCAEKPDSRHGIYVSTTTGRPRRTRLAGSWEPSTGGPMWFMQNMNISSIRASGTWGRG